MADQKVSQLAELAAGDLDPMGDFLLVSDMSAGASRKMKAAELIRASLPYLSGLYDFTTGVLPVGVSFARASAASRFNGSGAWVSEAADVPRFQYARTTLAPRGLLIEAAAVNDALWSQQLDNAYWGPAYSSVVANVGAGAYGTVTADRLVEDGTASVIHALGRPFTAAAGQTYMFSVFAKAATRSWISFELDTPFTSTRQYCWFDVGNGVVGTNGVTGSQAFIIDEGGGWYRCVLLLTAVGSGMQNLSFRLATGNNVGAYNGDGVSGVWLWGVQISVADAVTSYISTGATAVSRAADVAAITSPMVLADQCWIVKGRTPRTIGGAVNVVFQIDDGSDSNRRSLRYSGDGKLRVVATVGSVDQCDLDLGAVASDTDFAVAIRWADNNFAASLNGGAIVTDALGQNPLGMTAARIGRSVAGNYWNSTIRTIETRRTATNAELPLLAA